MLSFPVNKGLLNFSNPVIETDSIDIVNELGMQGWEMISVVPYQQNGYTHEYLFYFKRELK